MSRNTKLAVGLVAALVVAGVVWIAQGHDPSFPTAAVPGGAFASERAAEESTLPK